MHMGKLDELLVHNSPKKRFYTIYSSFQSQCSSSPNTSNCSSSSCSQTSRTYNQERKNYKETPKNAWFALPIIPLLSHQKGSKKHTKYELIKRIRKWFQHDLLVCDR